MWVFRLGNLMDHGSEESTLEDKISEKQFQLIVQGKNQATLEMRINKVFKNMIKSLIGVNMYRKLYRWVYNLR